jgi:hypothetical protein
MNADLIEKIERQTNAAIRSIVLARESALENHPATRDEINTAISMFLNANLSLEVIIDELEKQNGGPL